jgi:leader peptidase (prepilin peptidase)/N-methyltransferase
MILLSVIFGVLIGNYATTLLFRMPMGIEICGINKKVNTPPHCSKCKHPLKFYEYLPVLSWIFTRFKCNYCSGSINPQYFFLEFSTASISMLLFLLFGFSEIYLLFISLWVLSILSGLIEWNSEKIYHELTFAVMTIGLVYRTLLESTILSSITDIAIASIFLSFILKTQKFATKEIIHLILQSAVFGLVEAGLVLLTYIITQKISHRGSYLYSLMILFSVIILRKLLDI